MFLGFLKASNRAIDGKWEFARAVYFPESNDITAAGNLIRADFENHYVYTGDDDALPEWLYISTLRREQKRHRRIPYDPCKTRRI